MIEFVKFKEILEDPGLTFFFCIFILIVLALICVICCGIYEELYKPYIKRPICKYIEERKDRLMIKTSPLRLRGNNKNKYLKL